MQNFGKIDTYLTKEYDLVVIAIVHDQEKIRNMLIKMGVQNTKIVTYREFVEYALTGI